MTLGDVISEYRKSTGMSMEKFAEIAGMSKAYVSMLERNKTQRGDEPSPSIEMYRNVAKAINIDVDELIRKVDGKVSFDIPSLFSPLPRMKEWPVLGATACGKPLNLETPDETVFAPDDIKADVVFRCVGDSMINARVFDGDLVFVRLQPEVENGQIAVVRIDDEYTLKRFHAGDGYVELRAENPTFPPIILRGAEADPDRFEVVGLATAFLSPVK